MRRALIKSLGQFLATVLTTWMAFMLLASRDHFLYVWPLTAVQLAIAVTDWRGTAAKIVEVAGAGAGVLMVSRLLGMPLWIGASMATAQMLELGCAAEILTRSVTCFDDLKRRVNVLRFGLVAIAVPLMAVGLLVKPVAANTHASIWKTLIIVAQGDSLGIAVILPALLFLTSGEYRSIHKLRPHLRAGVTVLLIFLAVVLLIFTQNSRPFLFLVFPPLIAVLFVLGLEGAAIASPIATIVAVWASAHARGPIWLMHAVTPQDRIIVTQFFLATVAAVALPVGALLDERRQAERVAREGQSIYRTLIQNAEDMIILSDLNGARRFVSPAIKEVTGWTEEEFLVLGQLGGMHPEDRDHAQTIIGSLAEGKLHHTLRYRILCKDGSYRWVEAFIRGYGDPQTGQIVGYVATVRDISSQLAVEQSWSAEKAALARENQQLADLATRDELTGIANRRAFNRFLEHEAARQSRSANALSLLMIDVDHFKKFNDIYGHQAGDKCLRDLAQALQSRVRRTSDLLARVGGEEFAVVLPGTDEGGALQVAEDLLQAISNLNILHDGSPYRFVSISVGIATVLPYQPAESAQLIQHADRALYETKKAGRNGVSVSGDYSRLA